MNTALVKFDSILDQIWADNNPRKHKRLKFVNRSLVQLDLVEHKLTAYLEENLPAEQLDKLHQALMGCEGETRICEYVLELIRFGEQRCDEHVHLFTEIKELMQKAGQVKASQQVVESIAEWCSLAIYDSMQFLVMVKRVIAQLAAIYHVPYYYETEQCKLRMRASLLSTYKNLNTIIDDLQALNEALWMVRNPEELLDKDLVPPE